MDILTRIEFRVLAFELITHTPDCLDIVTLASKLTTTLLHMGIDCPGVSKIIVVSDIVQDFFSGQSYATIL